jgi:hypothetical protein
MERRHVKWRMSDAGHRTGRSDEEVVPYGSAALGVEALRVQPLQPGPQGALPQHIVSNVLSAPASPDARAFLPMPGVGLHDVALGEQGAVPDGTAQGILRPGRRALHLYGTMSRNVSKRHESDLISSGLPTFRHCLGRTSRIASRLRCGYFELRNYNVFLFGKIVRFCPANHQVQDAG